MASRGVRWPDRIGRGQEGATNADNNDIKLGDESESGTVTIRDGSIYTTAGSQEGGRHLQLSALI